MQPLKENPRVGFKSKSPVPHPGHSVPSFTAAIGDRWSLASTFSRKFSNQASLSFAYFQVGGGGTMTAGQSICLWGAQMVVSSSQGAYVETQNTSTVTGCSAQLRLPIPMSM